MGCTVTVRILLLILDFTVSANDQSFKTDRRSRNIRAQIVLIVLVDNTGK
jgi:hypothetical protein